MKLLNTSKKDSGKLKVFLKIKSLLIMVFVLAALSLAAYSLSKITQVTSDISLEDIKDCKTIYWNETEEVYGTCTQQYTVPVCDDEPLNTSCYIEERYDSYWCKTGTNIIEKSREECKGREMQIMIDKLQGTENYKLEYGDWGKCSYTTEGKILIITCDSKLDGNNDGICKPGESCVRFRITKDKIERLMKNSRYDFVENDETFFLKELDLGVIPK